MCTYGRPGVVALFTTSEETSSFPCTQMFSLLLKSFLFVTGKRTTDSEYLATFILLSPVILIIFNFGNF